MAKSRKPVAEFVLRCRGTRRHVRVHVYRNRKDMWAGAEKAGFLFRSGRAAVVDSGPMVADMFFSRGTLGSGLIAHEGVHAASWLLRNAPKIYRVRVRGDKRKSDEETLAFWTGNFTRAIVSEFYRLGFYK